MIKVAKTSYSVPRFGVVCAKVLAGCLLILASFAAQADVVRVAVAANFLQTAKYLAAEFEQRTEYRVELISGASGRIYAQIRQGAPYDLFLSADQTKPQQLLVDGLVLQGPVTYARGQLALWSDGVEPLDLSLFTQAKNLRLAIANPRVAPYGLAAQQVLDGLMAKAQGNSEPGWTLIRGENVAQVMQFVHAGAVDAGFVAYAQARQASHGGLWLVPQHLYAPILQDAVWLKAARSSEAVAAFWAFLVSEEGQSIIRQQGYL